MAVKDSEELKTNERYPLGDYSFRVERSSVPGSSNDKIEAICTNKDGKNARKSIQIPSAQQISSWYVEANETEATVYAIIRIPTEEQEGHSTYDGETVAFVINPSFSSSKPEFYGFQGTYNFENGVVYMMRFNTNPNSGIAFTQSPNAVAHETLVYSDRPKWDRDSIYNFSPAQTTPGGNPYYFGVRTPQNDWDGWGSVPYVEGSNNAPWVAHILFDGEMEIDPTDYEERTVMIGRFAIEIEDAGGDGPGSDWDDPGDYDPNWEEGDPTHTLHVEVVGALSGRHNDPIEDPSYSYIPSDKDTVKDYGCGGDGGHGGGGGAGASTVVIHKFATNQANSKEVTAIARRHGYGSGGGKGGKGGNGCILIYY